MLGVAQSALPAQHSPLAIDEQVTYYLAAGKTPDSVYQRCLSQSATPPLYFWLSSACWRLQDFFSGVSREALLRAPTVIAYFGSLILIFLLGERLVHPGAGGPAALLLAAQPELFFPGFSARPYLLGLFLLLVVIYQMAVLRQKGVTLGGWLMLCLANLALPWTHYLFAPIVVCEPLLLAATPRPTNARRSLSLGLWFATLIATAVSALALSKGLVRLGILGGSMNWITERRAWWAPITDLLGAPMVLAALAFSFLVGIARRRLGFTPTAPSLRQAFFLALFTLAPAGILWIAGEKVSPSLGQARYVAPMFGSACLTIVIALTWGLGVRGAQVAAVVLACLLGAPQRTWNALRQPAIYDTLWKSAAEYLNQMVGPNDLLLIHSGLVETELAHTYYDDPGYQEYTTSRLSDFYLNVAVERLTLPIEWRQGIWLQEYARRVDACQARGGVVWLVLSADTDLGYAIEQSAIGWLQSKGWRVETLDTPIAARLSRAVFSPSAND